MSKIYYIIFIVLFVNGLHAQRDQNLTLDEVIALAQSESPQVKLAEIRKSNAYWINQSFLSDYRPQIDLDLTLPALNRSIAEIIQPDGSSAFRERSQMRNMLSLSLSQRITATGATVFASTGIERLDIFKSLSGSATKNYLSNPLFFGFRQPLFGFNELKWNKRIMPMVYDESKARFSEDLEAVAGTAVVRFFNLLNAQMDLESSEARKIVAEELFQLGENRYSVGNIAETDLLQLEMDVMRSNTDISAAKLAQQTANEQLRNFLGIFEAVNFKLELPLEIPEVYVDLDVALAQSKLNRSRVLELNRMLLEAEQEVERTKAGTGLNGDLTGQFGLTGVGSKLNTAYSNLTDQELVTLQLTIPIADWGKSKAQYEIAKSRYELADLNTQLEKINFENEVTIAVQQFELVKENVDLAKRSYEASQKRYDLTRKRYVIGKVDVTQLNLADREQESQRQAYVRSVNQFWLAYYQLRSLTLYDFIKDESLVKDTEE